MSLRKIFKKRKKLKAAASIKRLDIQAEEVDGLDIGTRKIINLLNYTKRSASAYDGEGFDVGYHSFKINGKKMQTEVNKNWCEFDESESLPINVRLHAFWPHSKFSGKLNFSARR